MVMMRVYLIYKRQKKKMTQAEVAEYLKISERVYQYIETGARTGSIEIWDKLEDLFQTSQRRLRETK